MAKDKKEKKPKKKNKPNFNVLNFGTKKRIKSRWRKPRGTHNKKRMKFEWAGASPSIGYRNPSDIRGLHPAGMPEILISNINQLEGAKDVLIRISGKVGARKRKVIQEKADKLGLRVLNKKKEKVKEKSEKKVKKKEVSGTHKEDKKK